MFLKDLEFNKFIVINGNPAIKLKFVTGSNTSNLNSRMDKEKDKFDSNNKIRCKGVS